MKKLILLAVLFASSLQADFVRVWMGGNISPSTDYHLWAFGKHFLPVLPNVRIEHTQKDGLTNTEVFPYYNFLDNLAWITLDFGLGASQINDKLEPSVFARARGQMPLTGFGGEVVLKASLFGSDNYQDILAKLDYTVLDLVLIDIALEVGYRQSIYGVQDLALKDSQIFIGASARF